MVSVVNGNLYSTANLAYDMTMHAGNETKLCGQRPLQSEIARRYYELLYIVQSLLVLFAPCWRFFYVTVSQLLQITETITICVYI